MKPSNWLAGISVTVFGILFLLARWARRQENASLLKTGLCADAEIVASAVLSTRHGGCTSVTYRFLPAGYSEPVEVTKQLEGIVDIPVGKIMPVRYLAGHPLISLLIPYASRHNPS